MLALKLIPDSKGTHGNTGSKWLTKVIYGVRPAILFTNTD